METDLRTFVIADVSIIGGRTMYFSTKEARTAQEALSLHVDAVLATELSDHGRRLRNERTVRFAVAERQGNGKLGEAQRVNLCGIEFFDVSLPPAPPRFTITPVGS